MIGAFILSSRDLESVCPGSAGVPPNAAYFLQAKPFGVRQLAAALRRRPEGAKSMRH